MAHRPLSLRWVPHWAAWSEGTEAPTWEEGVPTGGPGSAKILSSMRLHAEALPRAGPDCPGQHPAPHAPPQLAIADHWRGTTGQLRPGQTGSVLCCWGLSCSLCERRDPPSVEDVGAPSLPVNAVIAKSPSRAGERQRMGPPQGTMTCSAQVRSTPVLL